MKWTEIKIRTTQEASDAISDMLTTLGAGGVAIEDPFDIRKEIEKPNTLDYADDNFLNSLGEDVIIKAYFDGSINMAELIGVIKEKIDFISKFLPVGVGYESVGQIDEEDWATAWKKYYKPINLSDKVVIKPTWELYEANNDEIIIELDPGMAFGTGTHETTRMCCNLLEKYIKKDDTVIDVGCGTGILAILAVKLGAKKVEAVDIDPVAVRITNENSSLNKVSQSIKAMTGVLDDIVPYKADVVVANIIANVIIDICPKIHYYLKAGGYLLTSGIIQERKQEVIDSYTNNGFSFVELLELGEWVAIVFKCQDFS